MDKEIDRIARRVIFHAGNVGKICALNPGERVPLECNQFSKDVSNCFCILSDDDTLVLELEIGGKVAQSSWSHELLCKKYKNRNLPH